MVRREKEEGERKGPSLLQMHSLLKPVGEGSRRGRGIRMNKGGGAARDIDNTYLGYSTEREWYERCSWMNGGGEKVRKT